jgi:hypothetical protein
MVVAGKPGTTKEVKVPCCPKALAVSSKQNQFIANNLVMLFPIQSRIEVKGR